MQSLAISDRTAHSVEAGPRDLLVLWQHPVTRGFKVIGRLGFDGHTYTFCYTYGAAQTDGFRALPGLRDISRPYQSDQLFPVFAQRSMDPSRPDFTRYVERLGLSPESATPWEQIIHSGGYRAADTIQLLEAPRIVDGRAVVTFLVHGVRYIPNVNRTLFNEIHSISSEQHEEALRRLRPEERLELIPEPTNSSNPKATLVGDLQGTPIGYVPDVLVHGIRKSASDYPSQATLRVVHVNGPDAPSHLRLTARFEAPREAAGAFPTPSWEPLVHQAGFSKD